MNKKSVLLIVLTVVLVLILFTAYMIYHHFATKTQKDQLQPLAPQSQPAQEETEKEDTDAQAPPQEEKEEHEASSQAREDDEAQDDQRVAAPDFAMENAEGETVRLSDLLGKPIVLNFWASWCPPCKSEMPEFDSVYQEMGEDVLFMMVNLTDGESETRRSALDYVTSQGFVFPVYLDTEQNGAAEYWITSIPTTFFIDKDGYIVARAVGAIDRETLLEGIRMAQGE